MKFVVSQEALQNELHFLQGIAEKKKTIPILSNILLRQRKPLSRSPPPTSR